MSYYLPALYWTAVGIIVIAALGLGGMLLMRRQDLIDNDEGRNV